MLYGVEFDWNTWVMSLPVSHEWCHARWRFDGYLSSCQPNRYSIVAVNKTNKTMSVTNEQASTVNALESSNQIKLDLVFNTKDEEIQYYKEKYIVSWFSRVRVLSVFLKQSKTELMPFFQHVNRPRITNSSSWPRTLSNFKRWVKIMRYATVFVWRNHSTNTQVSRHCLLFWKWTPMNNNRDNWRVIWTRLKNGRKSWKRSMMQFENNSRTFKWTRRNPVQYRVKNYRMQS